MTLAVAHEPSLAMKVFVAGIHIGGCALAAVALAHPVGAIGGAVFGAVSCAVGHVTQWLGRDVFQIINQSEDDWLIKVAYNLASMALAYLTGCLAVSSILGLTLSPISAFKFQICSSAVLLTVGVVTAMVYTLLRYEEEHQKVAAEHQKLEEAFKSVKHPRASCP